GTWEFSTDKGKHWQALGSPTDSAALLLGADSLVRFRPTTANFNGTATLTYRTWNLTGGTAGSTKDLSGAGSVGDNTPFSGTTATAAAVITAVNDRPVLDAIVGPMLTPVDVDDLDPAGDLVSDLIGGRAHDVDSANLGIAVVGVKSKATQGTW